MRFVIPDTAVTHFNLLPGDRVADIGAGSGHFSFAIAKKILPNGRVTAIEIQKQLAERIAAEARSRHITNVDAMWADIESPRGIRVSDGIYDAVVLANVLFQISDKAHVLTEAARILRPGGKLFVIDWTSSHGGMGPHPDHVLSEANAKDVIPTLGFVYERGFPAGTHHYGLVFHKA